MHHYQLVAATPSGRVLMLAQFRATESDARKMVEMMNFGTYPAGFRVRVQRVEAGQKVHEKPLPDPSPW